MLKSFISQLCQIFSITGAEAASADEKLDTRREAIRILYFDDEISDGETPDPHALSKQIAKMIEADIEESDDEDEQDCPWMTESLETPGLIDSKLLAACQQGGVTVNASELTGMAVGTAWRQ